VVLAVLVVAVVGAALSILSLSRDQAELQDHNVPYAVAISTAALNAKGIANDERGYLITGDAVFLEELEQRLLNVRTAFAEAAISANDNAQRRAVSEAHVGFERWIAALRRQVRMFQAGQRQKATKAALGPGRALRKDYEASLANAQDVAKTALQLRRNSFASSGWIFILLASLVLVLGVGVVVTFWLMHALDRSASRDEVPEAVAPVSMLEPRADRYDRRNG
jgi:methyl-accepting chemotaxis protein